MPDRLVETDGITSEEQLTGILRDAPRDDVPERLVEMDGITSEEQLTGIFRDAPRDDVLDGLVETDGITSEEQLTGFLRDAQRDDVPDRLVETDGITSEEQLTGILRDAPRDDVPDRLVETDGTNSEEQEACHGVNRLAVLLHLTQDFEALLLSGRLKGSDHERQVRGAISGVRRETADLDDCSPQDQEEIVESILAELQIHIASPAYDWLARQR